MCQGNASLLKGQNAKYTRTVLFLSSLGFSHWLNVGVVEDDILKVMRIGQVTNQTSHSDARAQERAKWSQTKS